MHRVFSFAEHQGKDGGNFPVEVRFVPLGFCLLLGGDGFVLRHEHTSGDTIRIVSRGPIAECKQTQPTVIVLHSVVPSLTCWADGDDCARVETQNSRGYSGRAVHPKPARVRCFVISGLVADASAILPEFTGFTSLCSFLDFQGDTVEPYALFAIGREDPFSAAARHLSFIQP